MIDRVRGDQFIRSRKAGEDSARDNKKKVRVTIGNDMRICND